MASSPHDVSDKIFPPFDPSTVPSQLLWLFLTFGVFYILMSRFALPRIGSVLEMRSDRIAQDFDEAERLSSESDAAREAYERELSDARSEAHRIAHEARERAKLELDSKRSSIESKLADRLRSSEEQIMDLRSRGMSNVDEIASEISVEIVDVVLGGSSSSSKRGSQ